MKRDYFKFLFLGVLFFIPLTSEASVLFQGTFPGIGTQQISYPPNNDSLDIPTWTVYTAVDDPLYDYTTYDIYTDTGCTYPATSYSLISAGGIGATYGEVGIGVFRETLPETIRCINAIVHKTAGPDVTYNLYTGDPIFTFIEQPQDTPAVQNQTFGQNGFFGTILFALGAIGGVYTFRQFLK